MTIKTIVLGILRRYFHTTICKLHYLRMEINSKRVEEEMGKFSLTVKELRYEDFLLGDKTVFNEQKLALYEERFKDSNYKAYGVIKEGKLAYSCWISLNKMGMPVETEPIMLTENEGYFEDDHCSPEFRGRGFHTQMLWFRLNELSNMGRNIAVITIMDGNSAALKPALKCGFEDMGCFYCGNLLGKKFNTLKKEKYSSKYESR